MSIIYHYCSVETFCAIITNKTVRLSDINKMNDSMERMWALEYLDEIIHNEVDNIYDDLDMTADTEKALFETQLKDKISRQFLKATKIPNRTYASCFSTSGDLLSQWRGYALDGTGVAIGFESDLFKSNTTRSMENSLWFGKVIYSKQEQIDFLQIALHYATSSLLKSDIPCEGKTDFFVKQLIQGLIKISPFVKNPAFKEEDEARFVYDSSCAEDAAAIPQTTDIIIGKLVRKPIQTWVRNHKIVSFFDLDISAFLSENVISEVVLGPKCQNDVDDIFDYLINHGIAIDISKIYKSSASYR